MAKKRYYIKVKVQFVCPECKRDNVPVHARGLCSACYQAFLRARGGDKPKKSDK